MSDSTPSAPLERQFLSSCPPWCGGHDAQHQPWHRPAPDQDLERLHAHYLQPVDGVPIWAGVLAVETRDSVREAGVVLELNGASRPDGTLRLTLEQAAALAGQIRALSQHAATWEDKRATRSAPQDGSKNSPSNGDSGLEG